MKKYLQTDFDEDSDHLVEVSDELNIWAAPFGLKLLENINYRKNITALDIGFGTGFPLTEIAMRLGNSCRVYGIDPWEAAIRRTRKKVAMYGITNLQIIHGMAENIPLEDDSVDLITSNNGLNNVSDLDKVLGECSRVMQKGGQFIQTMNLNDSMMEFYELMHEVLISLGMESYIEKMNQQIYSKRKPLQEVTDLIQSHGFIIEKVINDRFEYIFADGSSMLNHFFIRLAFLDGWKSIVPQSMQDEIFTRLEVLMNQQAEERGQFIMSIPFVVIDCIKR